MTQIRTPKGQISYPFIFKPRKNFEREQYSADIIFSENTDLSEIKKAIEEEKINKWGSDPKKHPKNLNNPIKFGDEDAQEYYKGKYYLTAYTGAENGRKLYICNRDKKILDHPSDIVGGDWCMFAIQFKAYTYKGKNGISTYLQGVQLVEKTDEPFSGNASAENMFDSMAEDDYEQNEDMFK